MSCIHCGNKTFHVKAGEVCSSCGYVHKIGSEETEEDKENGK